LGEAISVVSDSTGIMLSFNQRELDKYSVSVDSTFNTGSDAVTYLLAGLPFKIKFINSVTVIIPVSGIVRASGKIIDEGTGETLPYALVMFDDRRYMTDDKGYFSIPVLEAPVKLKVRYLGYVGRDSTLQNPSEGILFSLKPSTILLKEALLEGYETGNALQSGDEPGVMKINHIVAAYLPGNGDNSIFNLMRMMPGVRAVGEQGGLSVWGSKPGESSLLLDGARLFAMNGYNEQISLVNPFMVKDIRLHKGAYGPQFGNQTGALAEITGISGNRKRVDLKLNLNNQTANIFSSIPVGKNSVLSASYRQTFYGLFSPISVEGRSSKNEVRVDPDYKFRDANILYSGSTTARGSYRVSLLASMDDFSYNLDNDNAQVEAYEKNRQFVGSAQLSFNMNNGDLFTFKGGHSVLANDSKKIIRARDKNLWKYNEINVDQDISETFLKVLYNRHLFKNGKFTAGLEGYRHFVGDSIVSLEAYRASFFADQEFIFKNITAKGGLRADYFSGKFYFQPRAAINIDLSGGFKMNLAWGLYNQFVGKVIEIFEETAPISVWKLYGSGDSPVVSSMHSIAGISWSNNKFNISVEAFNKRSSGISQIIRSNQGAYLLSGQMNITGADLFMKWEYRGSQLFASATYGVANEVYSDTFSYKYSPFEIKSGAVINLSPFWLSAGFVFGNGYLDSFGSGRYSSLGTPEYSRLDLSATYEFSIKRVNFRTGVSVLNVLNTQNKKTLEIVPILSKGQGGGVESTLLTNLYAEAVPFSPAIYLEISF
jgi:hypothetical protein